MQKPIYLDNHATTPLDARALEAMMPYLGSKFGNAASRNHSFGWEAEKGVDHARKQVAELIGAVPGDVAFTSGATESNNLAIKGVMEAYRAKGNHIVTMTMEHKAVLDTVKHLERQGCRVTSLPPLQDGLLDLDNLRASLDRETVLVSVMYANNEIGVIQPIRQIGEICRERGVLFHCDAAQAVGKVPIRVGDDQIDLLSLSAHKIYGPKGIGALWVRRTKPRVRIVAQMDGGGHEAGMRSGTLNVPGIVGFGEACEISMREMEQEACRLRSLRDRLKAKLERELDDISVNGSMQSRLPGNLNLSFARVDGEALLMTIPDVALSTGSACTTATIEPSHVLRSIGIGEELARSAVRFGLGRFNTEEEIDYVADRVIESVRKLRALSPASRPAIGRTI